MRLHCGWKSLGMLAKLYCSKLRTCVSRNMSIANSSAVIVALCQDSATKMMFGHCLRLYNAIFSTCKMGACVQLFAVKTLLSAISTACFVDAPTGCCRTMQPFGSALLCGYTHTVCSTGQACCTGESVVHSLAQLSRGQIKPCCKCLHPNALSVLDCSYSEISYALSS